MIKSNSISLHLIRFWLKLLGVRIPGVSFRPRGRRAEGRADGGIGGPINRGADRGADRGAEGRADRGTEGRYWTLFDAISKVL